MTPFSASDAALEGFQLIGRRWRVVLGWAGFNLLALIMLVVVSATLSLVANAVGGGSSNGPAFTVAAVLALFCTLFAQAILAVGVFRLELRPEQPAFLHLRLGRDELRLVLVWAISLTGAWFIGWAATLVGHVTGVGGPWIELIALLLAIYLGLRFALAAPISFAERKIDFLRSWRLTNRRVLALLGMSALSLCLILLVMLAVAVVLGLVAGLTGGLDGLASLTGGADALKSHPGVFTLAFAVEVILTPLLWTLAMAPLVFAYRAFTAPATDAGVQA